MFLLDGQLTWAVGDEVVDQLARSVAVMFDLRQGEPVVVLLIEVIPGYLVDTNSQHGLEV